jgi:hypothetical protein
LSREFNISVRSAKKFLSLLQQTFAMSQGVHSLVVMADEPTSQGLRIQGSKPKSSQEDLMARTRRWVSSLLERGRAREPLPYFSE